MRYRWLVLLLIPLIGHTQNWEELQRKLPGIWIEDQLSDTPIGEYWEYDGTALSGYGFSLKGEDTLITEYFKIVPLQQELVYLAHPVTQHPTAFWLIQPIEKVDNVMVYKFENPEHDHPTAISYSFISDKEMYVCVYGGERALCYVMRKKG